MKRGMNTVISAVRVFCVISLVVAGLQVITACDGGDDGKEINLTYSFGCHGTYTYEDDVITITIADSTFPDEYGFQKGSEAFTVSYPADGEMTWTGAFSA